MNKTTLLFTFFAIAFVTAKINNCLLGESEYTTCNTIKGNLREKRNIIGSKYEFLADLCEIEKIACDKFDDLLLRSEDDDTEFILETKSRIDVTDSNPALGGANKTEIALFENETFGLTMEQIALQDQNALDYLNETYGVQCIINTNPSNLQLADCFTPFGQVYRYNVTGPLVVSLFSVYGINLLEYRLKTFRQYDTGYQFIGFQDLNVTGKVPVPAFFPIIVGKYEFFNDAAIIPSIKRMSMPLHTDPDVVGTVNSISNNNWEGLGFTTNFGLSGETCSLGGKVYQTKEVQEGIFHKRTVQDIRCYA